MHVAELLAFLIPAIGGFLLMRAFPRKVLWWEALIPAAPMLLLLPSLHYAGTAMATLATERIGGWVIQAHYYEDWDEYVHQTCTRTVSCGKDCTTTETYDCSYVAYHPPEWTVLDSNGTTTSISEEQYHWLRNRFGNEAFVELNRNYHFNDGDRYDTVWQGRDPSFTPIFLTQFYEHRPKGARGVFHYEPIVDATARGLHDYPPLSNYFNDPAILGSCHGSTAADAELQRINARLGASKQVRIWVLLFRDKPLSIGLDQQAHWCGGNNNEFVVCINLNNRDKPTWVHAFCWHPDGSGTNDVARINVRDHIMTHPERFQIGEAVKYIGDQVHYQWKRKSRDELLYLDIDVPTWVCVVGPLLGAVSLAGLGWFVVNNQHEEGNVYYPRRSFRR